MISAAHRRDMVILVGKAIMTSTLIAIIVIVQVIAAAIPADIFSLRSVDNAYSPFAAHAYWIP